MPELLVGGGNADVVIIPMFLILTLPLIRIFKIVFEVFIFLGKHSTNMWLTHSFYCYYFWFTVKLVYASQNAIIDYIILFGMSLLTSLIVNKFYNKINSV